MSKTWKDQRSHRRKVATTSKGLKEHQKRSKRRKGQKRPNTPGSQGQQHE